MNIELSDTDIIFIYGQFKKQLSDIDKIASSSACPLDKTTIKNQRAPYLSVIEKLAKQVQGLEKMDNCF